MTKLEAEKTIKNLQTYFSYQLRKDPSSRKEVHASLEQLFDLLETFNN